MLKVVPFRRIELAIVGIAVAIVATEPNFAVEQQPIVRQYNHSEPN